MRRRDALLTALAAAALPVAGCGSGDQAGTTTVRLLTPIFEGITGKRPVGGGWFRGGCCDHDGTSRSKQ